jgi:hypothetical protein
MSWLPCEADAAGREAAEMAVVGAEEPSDTGADESVDGSGRVEGESGPSVVAKTSCGWLAASACVAYSIKRA